MTPVGFVAVKLNTGFASRLNVGIGGIVGTGNACFLAACSFISFIFVEICAEPNVVGDGLKLNLFSMLF